MCLFPGNLYTPTGRGNKKNKIKQTHTSHWAGEDNEFCFLTFGFRI